MSAASPTAMSIHEMRQNVGRWVAWWAAVAPEATALVFDGVSITYAELERRVNRLANALRATGVERGDRVAILLSNRPEYIVTFFAAASVGAIVVPLNVRLVASELEFIVGDAEPRVLISEAAFAATLEALEGKIGCVEHLVGVDPGTPGTGLAEFLEGGGEEPVTAAGGWDEPLVICYTSGTVGLPKGAVLTNGNVFWASVQEMVGFGLTSRDRHLIVVPLCFTGGLITASMPIFHSGGAMYLEREFAPGPVLEQIERDRITRLLGVPLIFQAMAAHSEFASRDLGSLELALVGGAPVPSALVERYQCAGIDVFTNAYGLTEGGGFNLFLPSSEVAARPGAYLPALYTAVRVVDDDGADVEPGGEGELLLRGPTVMKGYWRNPDATVAAISEDGWLATGDVVRVGEDGYVHPIDRIKDMVITGGLNVYPAEVEAALFGHPDIADVAVVGLPDPKWGESVTAIVVPAEGSDIDGPAVIAYCEDRLADYKRPKGVIFVDELPRNASGKILKRQLRSRFADHYETDG